MEKADLLKIIDTLSDEQKKRGELASADIETLKKARTLFNA
jgi:hypothetical protein